MTHQYSTDCPYQNDEECGQPSFWFERPKGNHNDQARRDPIALGYHEHHDKGLPIDGSCEDASESQEHGDEGVYNNRVK